MSNTSDRLATIADEAFGPLPCQSDEDNLTAIEGGIVEMRIEAANLRTALAESNKRNLNLIHERDRARRKLAAAEKELREFREATVVFSQLPGEEDQQCRSTRTA